MPDPKGPAWPSGDSDAGSAGGQGDERTHELSRPTPEQGTQDPDTVEPDDQPTVWAERPTMPSPLPSEPEPEAGQEQAHGTRGQEGATEHPTAQLPLPKQESRPAESSRPGQPHRPDEQHHPEQHRPAQQHQQQRPDQQQHQQQRQTPQYPVPQLQHHPQQQRHGQPVAQFAVHPRGNGAPQIRPTAQPWPPPNQQDQPTGPAATAPPAGSHAHPVRIEPDGRQTQASATTGEQPSSAPADPGRPAKTGKGGKRALIGGGVALLLVIVLGVVLALPSVSNRLALPWAPNAPKGAPPEAAPVNLSLRGPDATTPAPTPSGVEAAVAGAAANPDLGTFTGSVVDPATGQTLWQHDAGTPLTPASTTKLLTAAGLLLSVDHGKQLSTTVVAGPEPGSVVLVAGGDITLSSLAAGKESVYPGAARLDDLVAQVKQAAGGTVTSVRLDVSAFTGAPTAPGWAPEDAPSTYATAVGPAMLDGGRSIANDDHSMRVGDPATVLAQQFAGRLGAQVGSPVTTTAPKGAKVLGEVRSAPLSELVDAAMLISDDVLAEILARQTAIAAGKDPSFAGGAEATLEVLRANGFDVNGVQLSDASGLSTSNRVPAKLLSDLLAVAAAPDGADPRTAKLRPMLGGLPVAGGSGTLADRYTSAPSDVAKGWIRAKTGTLSGVNTLAGIVLDADGRPLVFALMSSGPSPAAARPALDAVAAGLRGCGCR